MGSTFKFIRKHWVQAAACLLGSGFVQLAIAPTLLDPTKIYIPYRYKGSDATSCTFSSPSGTEWVTVFRKDKMDVKGNVAYRANDALVLNFVTQRASYYNSGLQQIDGINANPSTITNITNFQEACDIFKNGGAAPEVAVPLMPPAYLGQPSQQ